MALYTVSNAQMMFTTVLTSLIAAGTTVSYIQLKERQALPEVSLNAQGKCVKVLNFKNGDAYNCEDVDVILRNYKSVAVPAESSKDS